MSRLIKAYHDRGPSSGDVNQQHWSVKSLVGRLRKKKTNLDDFLVIGIDFGTTYSGASWATIADFENDEINLVTSWPDCGFEEGKAPSELHYDGHGRVSWGYSVPRSADPIRWFKLLLLEDKDLGEDIRDSQFLSQARTLMRVTNRTPTDLVADYLRGLWMHVLDTICRARSRSVIDALPFHVVITVPAIWKDYARARMREAAIKAGILNMRFAGVTTLAFAPEPEAAALSTLCQRGRDLRTGDVYVICDAGGGTVDLISYTVGDLDPIELRETVAGTGGLCGGIFIDEAFEEMCKLRLGHRWNNLSTTGIKNIMKDEWERAIKPQFKDPEDSEKEHIVSIPAEAFKDSNLDDQSRKPHIKNGRIHFRSSDIAKAFDLVFSQITELVDSQIGQVRDRRKSVKGVILVGGLGTSPYLYQHLQARYKRARIDVLQATGVKPRMAICRGAIFKGFLDGPPSELAGPPPICITSTISRASLGMSYRALFDAKLYLREDMVFDKLEGVWKADNQMRWYLYKGDDVSTKTPVRHEFYKAFALDDDLSSGITVRLSKCEDEIAPSRREDNVTALCDIKCDLEGIEVASLEDFTAANGRYLKKLSYHVEMVPSGASTEFAIYYNGRKLGASKTMPVQ